MAIMEGYTYLCRGRSCDLGGRGLETFVAGILCFDINMITYLYLALLAIHFVSPPLSPFKIFGFPPPQCSTLTPPLLM